MYNVTVTVDQVSEETNLGNNRQQLRFTLPVGVAFMPLASHRSSGTGAEILRRFRFPTRASALGGYLEAATRYHQKTSILCVENRSQCRLHAWPISMGRRKVRCCAEDASQSV